MVFNGWLGPQFQWLWSLPRQAEMVCHPKKGVPEMVAPPEWYRIVPLS